MTFEEVLAAMDDAGRAVVLGELSKKNGEAKSLRQRAKDLEALEAKLKVQLGVEAIDDEVVDRLAVADRAKVTLEEQTAALKRKLDQESKARLEAEAAREKLESEIARAQRDAEVRGAVSRIGLRAEAVEAATKLVLSDAAQVDGAWAYAGKPLGEYLKDFAQRHAYLLANPAAPGAGKPGDTGKPAGQERLLSQEEYMRMSKEERAANMDLIRRSAKSWT